MFLGVFDCMVEKIGFEKVFLKLKKKKNSNFSYFLMIQKML